MWYKDERWLIIVKNYAKRVWGIFSPAVSTVIFLKLELTNKWY